MNVALVADLVRAGHSFVGLSPDSMRKLAELRHLLVVAPLPEGIRVDPLSGATFGDDDTLVDALYRAVRCHQRNHTAWDGDMLQDVTVGRTLLRTSNVGRLPPPVIRGEPHREPEGSLSPTRRTAAIQMARLQQQQQQINGSTQGEDFDGGDSRDDTTPGGTRLFDVPVRLSTVATAPGAAWGIALTRHGLTDSGVHRCTVQVTALPPADESRLMPACTFGVATPDALEAGEAGLFIGMSWRVGTSLPCALQFVGTTANDQPTVRGANGHVFVKVGDVLSMELRPLEETKDGGSGDAHRSSTNVTTLSKYASLYAEQQQLLRRTGDEARKVEAWFFVNGRHVGTLPNVQALQPIVPSNKYAYRNDGCTDATGIKRQPPRGFAGSRFGVRLCEGAAVAVYSLGASEASR